MRDLPVVVLVHDTLGDVERAAGRLRDAGLRNPMAQLRSLGEFATWRAHNTGEIAFLIVHAGIWRDTGQCEAQERLPAYPAFVVETIGNRLMASMRLAPGSASVAPMPFDAHAVMRSLHALGLRWLVV